jgi:hemoglobin-like flavoprotein
MPVRRHPVATAKEHGSLGNLPLDRELVGRLQATFIPIRESGLRFGEIFYAKLFRSDPKSQTEKLVAALDTIVRNLIDPDGNAAMLAALGKRHAGYGVKPEHYDLVIDLLIDSMREILGPLAQPQHLDEWRMALRLVSDHMIAAAATEFSEPR